MKRRWPLWSFLVWSAVEPPCTAERWYDLRPNDPDTYQGRWVFQSIVDLPTLTLDDCWNIFTDDDAWAIWHPEVSNIRNNNNNNNGTSFGVGSSRVIDFTFLGTRQIEEYFDVWDGNDDSSAERRYSFYFVRSTAPARRFVRSARETFVCQTVVRNNNNSSRVIRTIRMTPGVTIRALAWFVYHRLERLFEHTCPQRLLEAIEQGELPIMVPS